MMSVRNGLLNWPVSAPEIYRLDFGSTLSTRDILLYTAATLILAYHLCTYLDLFPPLPLHEILWNCLVYATPSWMISIMDRSYGDISNGDTMGSSGSVAQGHAAKSDALRKILGLDRTPLFTNLDGNRVLSGVGTVWKGGSSRVPPGLGNWDNSCYQNSVIQGLASLSSLSEFLATTSIKFLDPKQGPTNAALKEIIEKLNEPANSGRRFWTPAELKSMSSWQQQDAQEYFSKVLDQVDKEITSVARRDLGMRGLGNITTSGAEIPEGKARAGQQPRDNNNDPETEKSRRGSAESQARSSLVPVPQRNPLEGLLAQRVGCMSCGYSEGLSLVPFNCLTLPLGVGWQVDIRDCLDEYTALEPIEGVECAKCTLLRRRDQLEKLLGGLSAAADGSPQHNVQQPPEALRAPAAGRLLAVKEALEDADFSETTLSKKCQIPPRGRVTSTKSRQAVIARTPKCLAVHINRSIFDEMTGALRKNYAEVRFPKNLNLGPWCLGSRSPKDGNTSKDDQEREEQEHWRLDPRRSMLSENSMNAYSPNGSWYDLRAVITHAGRHENGHYICYRKHPYTAGTTGIGDEKVSEGEDGIATERWWRLSDDQVSMVTEQNVLSQGGVFMLFYERIDDDENLPLSQSSPDAPLLANSPVAHEESGMPDEDLDVTPRGSQTPVSKEPLQHSTIAQTQAEPSHGSSPVKVLDIDASSQLPSASNHPVTDGESQNSPSASSALSYSSSTKGSNIDNSSATHEPHDLHEKGNETLPEQLLFKTDATNGAEEPLGEIHNSSTASSTGSLTDTHDRNGSLKENIADTPRPDNHTKAQQDSTDRAASKPARASKKRLRGNGRTGFIGGAGSGTGTANNEQANSRAKTTNNNKPATSGIPVIAAN